MEKEFQNEQIVEISRLSQDTQMINNCTRYNITTNQRKFTIRTNFRIYGDCCYNLEEDPIELNQFLFSYLLSVDINGEEAKFETSNGTFTIRLTKKPLLIDKPRLEYLIDDKVVGMKEI